jgi:hypothetical protein
MASPVKKDAKVAWAAPDVVWKELPMAGRLGRYMSMDIGATAVSDPSRITRAQGVRAVAG